MFELSEGRKTIRRSPKRSCSLLSQVSYQHDRDVISYCRASRDFIVYCLWKHYLLLISLSNFDVYSYNSNIVCLNIPMVYFVPFDTHIRNNHNRFKMLNNWLSLNYWFIQFITDICTKKLTKEKNYIMKGFYLRICNINTHTHTYSVFRILNGTQPDLLLIFCSDKWKCLIHNYLLLQ